MTSEAEGAFRAAMLNTLGHAPDVIEAGRFQRFATSERQADSAGWCRLFEDRRAGVFGCFRRAIHETWQSCNPLTLTRAERAEHARQIAAATTLRLELQRQEWKGNARRSLALWHACRPIERGDAAQRYLARRGLGAAWPLPSCLRLHPRLDYWHDGKRVGAFPAMLAPLVAPDGRLLALHRTWLHDDGRKAEVPSPRKLTRAAGPIGGACIPLARPARGRIGIGEGIETALAAQCASHVPTVAAYSASSLAAWQWPANVHRIVIFADADRAGREAADLLRVRALSAGLRVVVVAPSEEGADWADVWSGHGAGIGEGGAA